MRFGEHKEVNTGAKASSLSDMRAAYRCVGQMELAHLRRQLRQQWRVVKWTPRAGVVVVVAARDHLWKSLHHPWEQIDEGKHKYEQHELFIVLLDNKFKSIMAVVTKQYFRLFPLSIFYKNIPSIHKMTWPIKLSSLL